MQDYPEMKQEVLFFSQKAYAQRLFAGTSGNLSVYDREQGVMAITPSSAPYETMQRDDIIVMKLDGTILEGTLRPSSEWRMHAAIYAEKPQVGAVVHTHSPYATSFAVSGMPIGLILIEMIPFLGGDIAVADFALPGTPEVGTEALKVLTERNACLLKNHGVLAIGETLAQAHIRAVYVEDAAKICHFAKLNGKVTLVPPKMAQLMRDRLAQKTHQEEPKG